MAQMNMTEWQKNRIKEKNQKKPLLMITSKEALKSLNTDGIPSELMANFEVQTPRMVRDQLSKHEWTPEQMKLMKNFEKIGINKAVVSNLGVMDEQTNDDTLTREELMQLSVLMHDPEAFNNRRAVVLGLNSQSAPALNESLKEVGINGGRDFLSYDHQIIEYMENSNMISAQERSDHMTSLSKQHRALEKNKENPLQKLGKKIGGGVEDKWIDTLADEHHNQIHPDDVDGLKNKKAINQAAKDKQVKLAKSLAPKHDMSF